MSQLWATRRRINQILEVSCVLVVLTVSRRITKVWGLHILFTVHFVDQIFVDEKNTRETVDDEGWIHTGDVAELDECGRFKIVDRVKVRKFLPLFTFLVG